MSNRVLYVLKCPYPAAAPAGGRIPGFACPAQQCTTNETGLSTDSRRVLPDKSIPKHLRTSERPENR